MVLERLSWRVTCPNRASFCLLIVARRGFCGPTRTRKYPNPNPNPDLTPTLGTLQTFSGGHINVGAHRSNPCGTKYNHVESTPRSGELRTQKLKSHLARTQSLNVLPLKPGVGQYIAIHATLTAREFFLAYFYPSSPFTCIFFKTSPNVFLCWPEE